ncbi:MAG: nickel pincer cofactor biosynthesis protein LarC [bacterium]
MKRILWFDSVGGASGDMILSTLIDLGVRPSDLNEALASLGDFHIAIEARQHASNGMHGSQITVHAHEHHAHHHHESLGHHHHAPHRGLLEILSMIEAATLPADVKKKSIAVFQRLAEAEARVHGKTPQEVHFHEVGALDAIADIVGACLGLHLLHVDHVGFSPLPQGHGTITCAHGIFPNPAPGTVELLKGFAVTHTDEPYELVTPTGAALLTTWSNLKSWPDGWLIKAVGHGFGQRILDKRPNLLRGILLEAAPVKISDPDLCLVLETNIDDTTPELIGALVQKLMAVGAYDAFTSAIQMKKQRPATLLTVLCAPELKPVILDLIFTESTTFGIREHLTRRTMLEREFATAETAYGPIQIKIGRWHGTPVTASPEYDDCASAAAIHKVSVRVVYESAQTAGRRLLW